MKHPFYPHIEIPSEEVWKDIPGWEGLSLSRNNLVWDKIRSVQLFDLKLGSIINDDSDLAQKVIPIAQTFVKTKL